MSCLAPVWDWGTTVPWGRWGQHQASRWCGLRVQGKMRKGHRDKEGGKRERRGRGRKRGEREKERKEMEGKGTEEKGGGGWKGG